MTVHSIHIFDRRGKTLFTKTYSSVANQQQYKMVQQQTGSMDNSSAASESGGGSSVNPLDEQRKLVFGMLFSLNELMNNLSPSDVENSCKLVCFSPPYCAIPIVLNK
jgi:hypothetical protein